MSFNTKQGFDLFVLVVGARPNFVKMAPIARELIRRGAPFRIVHVGQHYDWSLSGSFFRDLKIPEPNVNLAVGSGTHAEQTAQAMMKFEQVISEIKKEFKRPLVVVFGDVNSTLAATLATVKIHGEVAHVESGLRSFDRTMPEEINRICVDRLASMHFVTEPSGMENLSNEGIAEKVFLVGNPMIDSLFVYVKSEEYSLKTQALLEKYQLQSRNYAVVTLHRPSLVDDPEKLGGWLKIFAVVAEKFPVVFPVHPRTRKYLQETPNLMILDPLEYKDFVALYGNASCVVTDSGGVQEETSALGIPCFTLRDSTERPATCSLGTNRLLGSDPNVHGTKLLELIAKLPAFQENTYVENFIWDGRSAERIVDLLEQGLRGY